LLAPATPLRVILSAPRPAIAWLKFRVNWVVVCAALPLAVTLFKVTLMRFTVTLQAAVLPPSAVVTVIVAVPAATAVTTPLVDTVAIPGLPLLHVTLLFAALEGATVAVRVSVLPTVRMADDLFRVTPLTGTGLTVTVQVAVLLPSAVVTVTVAVPAVTAVTTPPDTVATAGAPLLHVTFWLVALEGAIAAVKVSVPPTKRLADDLFRVTPVTVTTALLTVTAQAAVLPPSTVVAVITADPAATAVTTPFDTVALEVSLLLHVTFLFVALEGAIAAVRVSVPPGTIRLVDDLFRVTPLTATLLTVTVQVAVLLWSAVVTVIVAVP